MWHCFLVMNSFFLPYRGSYLPWWNEMPLSELEMCSLHLVVPEPKRDQISLLCSALKSCPTEQGEVTQRFQFYFLGAVYCFASSMHQSTLKEGNDFL